MRWMGASSSDPTAILFTWLGPGVSAQHALASRGEIHREAAGEGEQLEVSRQKHFGWMLFDDLIMYWHLRSNVDTAGAMQVGKDLQQKGVRSGSGP